MANGTGTRKVSEGIQVSMILSTEISAKNELSRPYWYSCLNFYLRPLVSVHIGPKGGLSPLYGGFI